MKTQITYRYDECLGFLQTQADANIKLNRETDLYKMHLSMIILHLHRAKHEEAKNVFDDAVQYVTRIFYEFSVKFHLIF